VKLHPRRARRATHFASVIGMFAVVTFLAQAAPKVRVEPDTLDFGTVRSGAPVTRAVILFNDGDATLEVFKVQASCGCSKVELPGGKQVSIAPAGKLELPVQFDPGNRIGQQNAVIAITTNDPERSAVTIGVSALIQAIAIVRPQNGLIWQQSSRGADIRRTVVIVPGDPEKDIEIVEVKTDRSELAVTANNVVRNKQKMIDLKFSLADITPLGDFSATVTARVRVGSEETTLSIPVRGAVVGDVVVTPLEINMTRASIARGERIGGVLVRGSADSAAPAIRAVLADGAVRADIQKSAGEQPQILVYAADDAAAGPHSASLYIATSSVDQPVVRVPVYFHVAQDVDVTPAAVVLDAANDTQRVQLRSMNGAALTIVNARSESDAIQVSVVSAESSDTTGTSVIEVRRATPVSVTGMDTRVVVETSIPGAAPIAIPVAIRP